MQEFDFVGTHYMLHLSLVSPTDKRKNSILQQSSAFIKARDKSVRQFMSLIGLLNSTFTQVHQMSRFHIRALQWHLSRHWHERVPYSDRVPVPHSNKCHLRWWGCSHNLSKGTPLHDLKPEARGHSFHRRLEYRMGCPQPGPGNPRRLVRFRGQITHKPAGI